MPTEKKAPVHFFPPLCCNVSLSVRRANRCRFVWVVFASFVQLVDGWRPFRDGPAGLVAPWYARLALRAVCAAACQ